MSLESTYRRWSIAPRWSGSLGILLGSTTGCEYEFTGEGLVEDRSESTRPRYIGGSMVRNTERRRRTPPVERPRSWRTADLNVVHCRMRFGGVGIGLSPLPGGFSVSTPDCPGQAHLWSSGHPMSARRLEGQGLVLDVSAAMAGVGAQVLGFNIPQSQAYEIADRMLHGDERAELLEAIEERNYDWLSRYFPMGALAYGVQFGVDVGITVYGGDWVIQPQ